MKKIKERIERYGKSLKIRTKYFLAILSISLVLIVLLGTLFQYISTGILFKNTKGFTKEFLEQLSYNLENNTEGLMESTYEVITDEDLTEMVMNADKTIAENGIQRYRQIMRSIGSRHFVSTSQVYATYVKDAGDNTTWWVRYSKEFNYADVNEEKVRRIFEIAEKEMTGVSRNTCWFKDPRDGRIYLARNLINTDERLGEVYGTVIFAIKESFFWPITSDEMLINNENLVIRNNDSDMIYTQMDDKELTDKYVLTGEEWYGSHISEIRTDGETYIFAKRVKNATDWSIYCFIPEDAFMDGITSMKWDILLIAFLALLFSLLASGILSRSMTRNIHYLEKNMQKAEKGDFNIHIEPTSYDEIGMLCQRFNYMADKIQELIKEAYQEGKTKQKLKLQVLKAQINPHFLYNSLGSIRCMARMEKQESIAEMTSALIELLRASLSKTGEYQTVKEEIEYIRNYFVLQRYRYEDSFQVIYRIAPETEACIMLNFILQPLVENAIFHGIEISKGTGVIVITSSLVKGKLRLTVEDNGVGMTEEKIRHILHKQEEKYEGLNSIGVANVSQRIKRYFGEEYGLDFMSEPGNGSVAEVWLPLIQNMEEVPSDV